MSGFRLYLITDRKLAAARAGLVPTVEAALAAAAEVAGPGAIAVQLREKDLGARELCELARALRNRCDRYDAPLLINDRIDVAIASGASGVHLPANSFAIADARAIVGPSRLVGVSTHDPAETAAASLAGADFAVFGPVHDPISKAPYGRAAGLETLAQAVRAAHPMPVYALGGITPERAAEIARALDRNSRPSGVAVIGAVFAAADPADATRRLLNAVSID
ncbi:MAG TPA: thiamine phosphate synthase [Candidatus Binataceae bacterium]|nr:thiamine phosphate synthase [Candidatus Binataceae bacterium]